MKHTIFIKAVFAASAIAALVPSQSLASDTGHAWVAQTSPGSLTVKSNGSAYTKVDHLGNFGIQGRLQYDTGTAGRVVSWTMTPVIQNGYGVAANVQGLGAHAQSKSYPSGSRPKTIDRVVNMSVPVLKVQNHAVGICNAKAQSLRNQGKSDNWIFSRDHEVSFNVDVNVNVNANGAGSSAGKQAWEVSSPHSMKIKCAKWTGAQIDPGSSDLKSPLAVSWSNMQLKELVTMGGACKIDTLTGFIATEANATIKYRFVHSSGKKSKVFKTTTNSNKAAEVKHKWDIPNKPGPENGWVQIEGVSPKFKTNKAHYSMNCKTKAPGGLTSEPSKPQGPKDKATKPSSQSKPKGPNKLKTKKRKLKLKLKTN